MSRTNDALYYEAVRELELGSTELALRFVKEEPESERSAIVQSQLHEIAGNTQSAADVLSEFIKKHLDSGVARGNLARLQWQLGQPDKALTTLRFALAQKPNQERTLHFYASLLEEQNGFNSTYRALLGLSKPEGAWMPAWVAAILSATRGEEQLSLEALLQCAQRSGGRFPPHADSFLTLLERFEAQRKTEAWQALRPYCSAEITQRGDRMFASMPEAVSGKPDRVVMGSIIGGTASHALLSREVSTVFLTPVRLIKPESWHASEIAGALGRGLALLLAEFLLSKSGVVAEVGIPSSPENGLLFSQELPPVSELLKLAPEGTGLILSAYLSRKADGSFTVDCEKYDGRGGYLGHTTANAVEPGLCIESLAGQLDASLTASPNELPSWRPSIDLDGLMAKDTAAAFLLCQSGALNRNRLPNPGLSLDLLAEHASGSQNPLDLVSYYNAVCAADSLGVPSASEQRALVTSLLQKDETLRQFIQAEEGSGPS